MHRLPILVSLVIAALSWAGAPEAHRSMSAQVTTPTAMAKHPVVGAWRFDTNAEDPANPPSYAIFHADGTYTESHPTVGLGIGAWEAPGETTADLTIVFADLDPAEAGFSRGELVVHATVAVDATGDALTAPYTFEGMGRDGASLFVGALTATGTRIKAEPMVPLATPIATP